MLLVGGLTSFFTKNMIFVLLIPLIVINFYASNQGSFYEGMETTTTTDGDVTSQIKENRQEIASALQDKNASNGNNINESTNGDVQPKKDRLLNKMNSKKNGQEESFEVGRKKNYDLDYASTVEDAYSELNKIIGGDGIQRLTADTQNLMKQQLQLAEAMKSMGPLIDNMKPIMESMGPLLNQANGFMKLAK